MNIAVRNIFDRNELSLCAGKEAEVISLSDHLGNARINEEYTIREIKTNDEELKNFLFSLGCFAGEKVSVMSILAENLVISIKDARYSIDADLAKAIVI